MAADAVSRAGVPGAGAGAVAALRRSADGFLDSSTRLHRLEGAAQFAGLQVEAFVIEEALDRPWRGDVVLLHERHDVDLDALLARPATLVTVLADGSEHRRSGQVLQAMAEESDGGFARYRLTLQPWLGFLSQTLRSQVWQERHLVEIVESVLGDYSGLGRWRWAPCVGASLRDADQGGVRSYCVQYRESDLDFIGRLLAEEGIGYRFEESAEGEPGPTVVFFADSTSAGSCPEDIASAGAAGGAGIRLHRDDAREAQDTIQAFGALRSQPVAAISAASHDYKTGRVVGADVPARGALGGANALRIASHDSARSYAWADASQAERALRLRQEASEARHERWLGRGVVRSFAAGATFVLSQPAPGGRPGAGDPQRGERFLLTGVTHVGINNLPKDPGRSIAGATGGAGDRRRSDREADVLPRGIDPGLRQRAAERGYANRFDAIRAEVPWRPLPADGAGAGAGGGRRVGGPLTATVVGADGSALPAGGQEVHVDALGRVRIRYEFQDPDSGAGSSGRSSTWVRVQQPLAGDGTGSRWIPRIGHEVLVGHFNDDIERPYIICSLYNGRGEGGEAATPGGRDAPPADAGAYGRSTDARPGAQGNLAGGSAPAWHGGSPGGPDDGGQRNAGALGGYKTKEFGGEGFSQLVFDDSAAQLRVQLATTQHASQLSLGHLIHQADNHRGSFRGQGFELRTDAYGAVRAGRGVLLTTYRTTLAEPAGDNAAGIALAKRWAALSKSFSDAARLHRTVEFSGVIGAGRSGARSPGGRDAPVPAWVAQAKGMVSGQELDAAMRDADGKSTAAAGGQVPHGTDAVVQAVARAGLAMVAGQDAVLVGQENVQLASGQDIDCAAGGAWRAHAGQAIGILAGAGKPGDGAAGTGLTMVAGAGDLDIQARTGTLQVAARDELRIQSQSAAVDWTAAKRIVLSTAGGASLVIEGGHVTFMCPGTIAIRSGVKRFLGPRSS